MKNYSLVIKILGIRLFSLEIIKEDEIKKEISKKQDIIPLDRKIYQGSVKPDLKELENKINPQNTIKPMLVTCASCTGTTYDDDINICSSCGISTCSSCGSYDPQSKSHYCNECWKKI